MSVARKLKKQYLRLIVTMARRYNPQAPISVWDG
jgi:hypothetical protein